MTSIMSERGTAGPAAVDPDAAGAGGVEERVRAILAGILPAGAGPLEGRPLRELGLSSLAATRFVLELRTTFGVDVPLLELDRHGDVRGLAAWVAGQVAGGAAAGAGPAAGGTVERAGPAGRHEPFPLTPLQQAYLVGAYDPDDPVGCHLYRELPVEGLDVARLRGAWQQVVARHEALRAEVTPEGRQRVREVSPGRAVAVHDAGGLDAAGHQALVEQVRERVSRRGYEPGEPMVTVEVTHRPGGRSVVHLSIDALLTDGVGLELLLRDWWHYYTRPDEPLPEPPVPLRDCVTALHAWSGGASYEADLEYWMRRLATPVSGPDILRRVPGGDRDDGPARSAWAGPDPAAPGPADPDGFRRRPLEATLAPEQWRALRDRAARTGVPPNALLLAAFTQALERCGAAEPYGLVLTTTLRGYLPAGADTVVGPFASTTVLVVDGTAGLDLDEAAGRLHERLWQDLDHATVSGPEAVRELRRRQAGADPVLPVVFTSMVDAVAPATDGFGAGYALSRTSGVALDAQLWEHAGGLRLHWDVTDAVLPAGVVDVVFSAYVNGLVAAAAHDPTTDSRRALNELQQAYVVARAAAAPSTWDGCQVYHSFRVRDLDLSRLEAAWVALVRAYEPLRTVVTTGGDLVVRQQAPQRWRIPLVRHDTARAREQHDAWLAQALPARAFPLDAWPQSDLRVTCDGGAESTVHLTLDLVACDGRSVHFLLRELFRLYADPAARPPGAAPHDQWLASRAGPWPEQEEYWRRRVDAIPAGPSLPMPGAPADTPRRSRHQGTVPGWRDLRGRAGARGVGPDALVMAVLTGALATRFPGPFAVPLVRWTGAARPYRPGEYTALSWLAHRPGTDVWERAAAYQAEIDADVRHDQVSGLGALRRRVLRERSHGYPVVCTGLLDLAGQPLPDGVTAGDWRTCTPDVAMDCIAMDCGDDELRCYWDVVEAQFAPGVPAEVFARFLAGLRELAGAPAGLDPAERHRIVYEWNDTAREVGTEGPVHRLFEEQVRRRPDGVVVRWSGGSVTYRELNDRANALAHRLRALGVGRGSPVGVRTRRGPDLTVAVYGVLKAGGAYVPVEPRLPAGRAHGILADVSAAALVTTSDASGWAPPNGLPVADLDAGLTPDPRDPVPVAGTDDLAYIIYTSGSTGIPKGVAVTHRPLHNLFQWCARSYGFGPGDLGLCVTSLGFDLSVFDLLGLPALGAAVYVADETQRQDPALLLDVLRTEPVTFWNSAPTALAQLAPQFPEAGAAGTGTLRLVFLSGDYTPLSLPGQLSAAFPHARLVSLGGATEATVWSNYFSVDTVDPRWRSVPYGWPIDNSRYYILDGRREPVPPGQEGDLWIAGTCLSLGYVNRPGLTADRFVPDPFVPGERMYDTGDRATYLPDGTISFLGRRDHQVKIRGFRVELGEIEHRLRQHPTVRDAVVVARPDASGDRKLAAYLLPAGGDVPAASDLRAFAAGTLPDYMVPNHLTFLERYPATANGKLDRDALPWPIDTAAAPPPAAGAAVTGPPPAAAPSGTGRAALTDEISALLAELLGVDNVDPEQDLWDQGATSFTMVQVSGALRRTHRQRVPVSALLADPTVRGIAAAVAGSLGGAAPGGGPGEVEFFDPAARAEFHRAGWNRRAEPPDASRTPLAGDPPAPAHHRSRASRRDFTGGPVDLAALGELLRLLRPVRLDDRDRYLYPSAGDTYAVQVYLYVPDGGVRGLAPGAYYYRPDTHALEPLSGREVLDRTAHFAYNRDLYDRAAFELLLVGQTRGIAPLYAADAERFLALEAGYLGGLLMSGQAAAGVGLCPIGSVAPDRLRSALDLDDGHRFLQSFLGGAVPRPDDATRGAAPASGHRPAPPDAVAPLALVGMAGRFPGAPDPTELWRLLAGGRRAIGPMPAHRAAALGLSGPLAALPGGYLDDVEAFDSLRYRIAPAEAQTLDPRARLVLEAVSRCLEDAGYTPDALAAAGRVGVYVATMWPDHHATGAQRWQAGGPAVCSGVAADLPNRVSFTYGFTGPSVAVDTACSSALTALHLAGEAIRRGECDSAVVVAVNLVTHPYHLALLDGLGLLAGTGDEGGRAGDHAARHSTAEGPGLAFAAAGSGWLPGEGVGALLLRPLRAAAGRDPVHAVVEATGTGHAGRTTRFGAPDPDALAASIGRVLHDAGLAPGDVAYAECAAPGAAVADAAELEALGTVFAGRAGPLPVGSVKPNIGHLEAASGMTQLAKVLLQLRYGRLAPTLVAARRNPLVGWDPAVLRVVDAVEPWPAGPRRALVNAVAATGSYAHVVLRAADR